MTKIVIANIEHYYFNDTYETQDTTYEVNIPLKKIVKFCLKNKLHFKVGFLGNKYYSNADFIEITDAHLLLLVGRAPEIIRDKNFKVFKNLEKYLKHKSWVGGLK